MNTCHYALCNHEKLLETLKYLIEEWINKSIPIPIRRRFHPWVRKIPWRREQLSTSVFWPGEFHVLYGPWGHKESDTTERLSLHFSVFLSTTISAILLTFSKGFLPDYQVHFALAKSYLHVLSKAD